MSDIAKLIIGVIVAALIIGFVFKILLKVGIILLVGLGVIYLFKKVFGSNV